MGVTNVCTEVELPVLLARTSSVVIDLLLSLTYLATTHILLPPYLVTANTHFYLSTHHIYVRGRACLRLLPYLAHRDKPSAVPGCGFLMKSDSNDSRIFPSAIGLP